MTCCTNCLQLSVQEVVWVWFGFEEGDLDKKQETFFLFEIENSWLGPLQSQACLCCAYGAGRNDQVEQRSRNRVMWVITCIYGSSYCKHKQIQTSFSYSLASHPGVLDLASSFRLNLRQMLFLSTAIVPTAVDSPSRVVPIGTALRPTTGGGLVHLSCEHLYGLFASCRVSCLTQILKS